MEREILMMMGNRNFKVKQNWYKRITIVKKSFGNGEYEL